MWLGEDDTMQGVGCAGAEGTDGQLYQWVEGVDGLGNAVGFWRPTSGVHRAHRMCVIARRFSAMSQGCRRPPLSVG